MIVQTNPCDEVAKNCFVKLGQSRPLFAIQNFLSMFNRSIIKIIRNKRDLKVDRPSLRCVCADHQIDRNHHLHHGHMPRIFRYIQIHVYLYF